MKRVSIEPVTRIEGHGRVEIFLDEEGRVAEAFLVVPELRGFESLCVGRPAEEMPRLTSRICGLCPEAHHLASVKALDDLWQVSPPPAARKLRELLYSIFFFLDHTTHFFALGGPDFLLLPDTPPGDRHFLTVLQRIGSDGARKVIDARSRSCRALEILGGRTIHPVAGLPGGWSRTLGETDRSEIEAIARGSVDFALWTLELYREMVLDDAEHRGALEDDTFSDRTHSLGMVDEHDRANFYDGTLRVVDPDGREILRFPAADYSEHLAEHVVDWSYSKLPYLRSRGWSGWTDGAASGIYGANPLARLNVSDSLATPLAHEHFEELFETLSRKDENGRHLPVHNRMALPWARLVELLYAAERALELARDPEITDPRIRSNIEAEPRVGVGCVEAPRGTLIHRYRTDPDGILTEVDLLVGTTHNQGAMALTLRRALRHLVGPDRPLDEAVLHRVETVLRCYDPCLSCATHAFPGRMPLEVTLRDSAGTVVDRIVRS